MITVPVEKVPPQNLEAEQSLLGACLIDKEVVNRVSEILQNSGDFYREAHRNIYDAILHLNEKGEGIDIITLTNELRNHNQLESAGGIEYLNSLMDFVPTTSNAEHYASIIKDKAILRSLIYAGTNITTMGFNEQEPVESLVDRSEELVFRIGQRRLTSDFQPLKTVLSGTFERIEDLYARKSHVTGVPTGYRDLDHFTAGFQRANLVVLAARPGMGKTAFCLNLARHIAGHDKLPVAIFSLEMSKDELGERLLCAEAEINAMKLRTGHLSDSDWPKITRAINTLSDTPLYIDDSASLTMMEIRSKARRLKSKFGLELMILDYLQLISPPGGGGGRSDNRNQEISLISRQLKALSKELNLPVIAISQLSREVEKRSDKRPVLSDLRDSGAIEQEADLVLFIYRDEVYHHEDTNKTNVAEIIIAKQRNGPIANFELLFLKEIGKFVNIERFRE